MIRRGDVSTRAEVGEATGLSRMTVAQRVDSLLAAGLVREEGAGVSTGGRRPTLLRFDVDRAVVLAASVDTTHTRVAVLNLEGLVLHEMALTAYISDGPEAMLKSIAQAFLDVLAAVGRSSGGRGCRHLAARADGPADRTAVAAADHAGLGRLPDG